MQGLTGATPPWNPDWSKATLSPCASAIKEENSTDVRESLPVRSEKAASSCNTPSAAASCKFTAHQSAHGPVATLNRQPSSVDSGHGTSLDEAVIMAAHVPSGMLSLVEASVGAACL
jgi:hypothetical protein